MKHVLGIDFGKQHIGLAVAITPLAEPLETIPITDAFERIRELVDEYQIGTIVVGMSEGEMAEASKEWGEELERALSIEVVFQDETLSSTEARLKMAKAGKKKSVREGKIDHMAAALILQDYLDQTSFE